jgi:hypothetical protein
MGREEKLAVAGNAVNCDSLRIYAMKYITENVTNELIFSVTQTAE